MTVPTRPLPVGVYVTSVSSQNNAGGCTWTIEVSRHWARPTSVLPPADDLPADIRTAIASWLAGEAPRW